MLINYQVLFIYYRSRKERRRRNGKTITIWLT